MTFSFRPPPGSARKYIESVGGWLHGFWYAFGSHDARSLHSRFRPEADVTPEGGLENRQMPSADPAGHQREPPDQFRYPLDQLNANAVIRIQ